MLLNYVATNGSWCPIFTPCCLVGKRKMNTVHIPRPYMYLGIGHQAETGHHQSSSSSFSPSLSLSSPSSLSPSSSLSLCSSPSSSSSSSSPPSSSSSPSLSVSPQFPLFVVLLHHPSFIYRQGFTIQTTVEQNVETNEAVKLRFNLLTHPDHHPHGALLYIDIYIQLQLSIPHADHILLVRKKGGRSRISTDICSARGHCASKRMMVRAVAPKSQTLHCWWKSSWVLAQAGVFDFALFRFCFLWIFLVGVAEESQPLFNINA